MVEDSEDDALLLIRELRRGAYKPTFERVDNPEAMKAALENKTWDVVIADYVMPRFSGLDALTLLHRSGLDLPFIIVSGKIGEDIAVEAMRAGANDYFLKGNLARLVPAIERELREAAVIKERKNAEEALRESESRYRGLVESAKDFIFTVSNEGQVTSLNPAFETITGWARSEWLGKHLELFVHPDDVSHIIGFYDCYSNGDKPSNVEMRILSKTGEYLIMDVSIVPQTRNGNVVNCLGIARDITKRKKDEEELRRAHTELERIVVERTAELVTANEELKTELMERKRIEEALRENQDLLNAVFSGTNDAIFVKDRDCRLIMANPATLSIIGKTAQEVLGRNDAEIYENPEIGRSTMENDYRIMASGYSEIVEEIIDGPQGRQIFLSTKAPRLDADGRIIGIIGVACNITDRKRAEEELRKAHDELEIRVQERTAQLTDSLNEKEILLREIHHRVKNNMQVISGLLMLQEESSDDEKIIEILKDCQNRISSMALIHEKLYRSKNLSKINFKEYIDDLITGIFDSHMVTRSKIALNLDVENISFGIDLAIPCGLIINELVTNSLKYAFPDGKKGEIKVSLHSTGENLFELMEGDNGVGISDALDFRKTKSLGLHIVNILVENQLHGEITLDKNKGTKFRIIFRGQSK
ncbi:MAG: PAS domain S-box protein [Candidatus Methanoperedens sp.]|nr:PAS domain S-box protein [Candidatus Methanoperedens sp.]